MASSHSRRTEPKPSSVQATVTRLLTETPHPRQEPQLSQNYCGRTGTVRTRWFSAEGLPCALRTVAAPGAPHTWWQSTIDRAVMTKKLPHIPDGDQGPLGNRPQPDTTVLGERSPRHQTQSRCPQAHEAQVSFAAGRD